MDDGWYEGNANDKLCTRDTIMIILMMVMVFSYLGLQVYMIENNSDFHESQSNKYINKDSKSDTITYPAPYKWVKPSNCFE